VILDSSHAPGISYSREVFQNLLGLR